MKGVQRGGRALLGGLKWARSPAEEFTFWAWILEEPGQMARLTPQPPIVHPVTPGREESTALPPDEGLAQDCGVWCHWYALIHVSELLCQMLLLAGARLMQRHSCGRVGGRKGERGGREGSKLTCDLLLGQLGHLEKQEGRKSQQAGTSLLAQPGPAGAASSTWQSMYLGKGSHARARTGIIQSGDSGG